MTFPSPPRCVSVPSSALPRELLLSTAALVHSLCSRCVSVPSSAALPRELAPSMDAGARAQPQGLYPPKGGRELTSTYVLRCQGRGRAHRRCLRWDKASRRCRGCRSECLDARWSLMTTKLRQGKATAQATPKPRAGRGCCTVAEPFDKMTTMYGKQQWQSSTTPYVFDKMLQRR
ncbi:hypothetical protein SORBI_3010G125800 [Sorghum bicolor]|uniref:Uncharacterized protein n=1 Tax=Sorghum bicolor TaxID=4558 RepID=A0A1W0VSM2_SORBI|nr:hypothetical protein SORBI_3010G125800 [Sorghum bicolor]